MAPAHMALLARQSILALAGLSGLACKTAALCSAAADAPRCMSSMVSSLTDQLVDYALTKCQGKHDQAVDVLQSGLSMQPKSTGVDAARLWVARGSVEADRCQWDHVLDCTGQAHDAVGNGPSADAAQSQVQAAATRLAVQTLLTQGRDEEAIAACKAAIHSSTPPEAAPPGAGAARIDSLSLTLTVSHVIGKEQLAQAAAQQLNSALEADWAIQTAQGTRTAEGQSSRPQATALLALADWQARRGGDAEKALALYTQAAELTSKAVAPGSWPLLDEVHASALTGSAQLSVVSEQWDAAEELLGRALAAAEALSSDRHPRTVAPLVLLGYVYARSARVTFAEGLFRECAKILKVDAMSQQPGGGPPHGVLPTCVHPSLVAVLCWRYHQLLAALPNRGRESEAWEQLAQWSWAHAGAAFALANSSIQHVMGSSNLLTGKGHPGIGLFVSMPLRRAMPLVLH